MTETPQIVTEVQLDLTADEEPDKYAGIFRPEIDQARLEVQQSDPESPLYSTTTFEELELKPELLKAVRALNFKRPSRIQEIALPTLIKKPLAHFVGQAQAGTGKTAAFGLSLLQKINLNNMCTQALVICPTLELAGQIFDAVKSLGQFMEGLTMELVVKGFLAPGKICPHIIVATPGRLLDLIGRRLIQLSKVSTFVIDEADKMIDDAEDMWQLTDAIISNLPSTGCQICLFSATYSTEVAEKVEELVPSEPDRTIVRIPIEKVTTENVREYYFALKNSQDRLRALKEILDNLSVGSVVIFVNQKSTADTIGRALIKDGYPVSVLHGDINVEDRLRIFDDFANYRTRFLITTNVLARGIDVASVTVVINYDLPFIPQSDSGDVSTYIHRIGRAGRFGREGIAISFTYDSVTQDALGLINAELKAIVDGKPKRQRMMQELTFENIALLSETIQNLA